MQAGFLAGFARRGVAELLAASGQPFGSTQRPVSRLVISMISTPSSALRHGSAATCRRQGALPNKRRTLSTKWLPVSMVHDRIGGNCPKPQIRLPPHELYG